MGWIEELRNLESSQENGEKKDDRVIAQKKEEGEQLDTIEKAEEKLNGARKSLQTISELEALGEDVDEPKK